MDSPRLAPPMPCLLPLNQREELHARLPTASIDHIAPHRTCLAPDCARVAREAMLLAAPLPWSPSGAARGPGAARSWPARRQRGGRGAPCCQAPAVGAGVGSSSSANSNGSQLSIKLRRATLDDAAELSELCAQVAELLAASAIPRRAEEGSSQAPAAARCLALRRQLLRKLLQVRFLQPLVSGCRPSPSACSTLGCARCCRRAPRPSGGCSLSARLRASSARRQLTATCGSGGSGSGRRSTCWGPRPPATGR